jgi:hypothetical protein
MTAVSHKIRLSGKSLSSTTGTGGPFPWTKARPGRDDDENWINKFGMNMDLSKGSSKFMV